LLIALDLRESTVAKLGIAAPCNELPERLQRGEAILFAVFTAL
jgi:hypothetical protein